MKIILFILLMMAPVAAQTRNEFHQKYDSTESSPYHQLAKSNIYVVRPSIIMSVDFSDQPLWKDYACQAIIKPETTSDSSEHKVETISSKLALEIIDEIVPEVQRGKLIDQLRINGGCTGIRIDIYENMTIGRTTRCEVQGGGTYQASIQWNSSWCKDNKK
jgi:hypothetical protein